MTIKSWITEFIPEMLADDEKHCEPFDPSKLTTRSMCMEDLECVDHCIKKWTGLKPENTERHGLNYNDFIIQDLDTFEKMRITSDSCTLCHKYAQTMHGICYNHTMEEVCPFIRTTGRRCDSFNGPWEASESSPDTMLKALKHIRNYVLAETLMDNTD